MNNAEQEFKNFATIERLMTNPSFYGGIKCMSDSDRGFFMYKKNTSLEDALRINRNHDNEVWEVYDPNDEEDPELPVFANRDLTKCVHFCISIL